MSALNEKIATVSSGSHSTSWMMPAKLTTDDLKW